MVKSLSYATNGLVIALLLATACSQIITVKNIGCKNYNQKQVCIECSTRYYLDSNAICQPVNPNCKTYNSTNGACLSCYPGFGIIEDTCLPGVVTESFDSNCNTFNGSLCSKCSKGYFLGSNGKCQSVNPSCKDYDPQNGYCTSCFAGYAVKDGLCVVSQADATVANCNSIDPLTGLCLKCSYGYYFDSNNNCIQQSVSCKSFDTFFKVCKECYPGYTLSPLNVCVKEDAPAGDPNCKTFQNNKCVECSKGAIFNPLGFCIIIDPSCATFDQQDGKCTSCYPGYKISENKTCIKDTAIGGDPNCKTFKDNKCVECSQGAVFNKDGICTIVDPSCASFNQKTGLCTACFSGYALSSTNKCVKDVAPSGDPNCKTFKNNKCVECSYGAIFNRAGVCILIDPTCYTFNQDDGSCTSCYPGYEIKGKTCVISNKTDTKDPFCKKFYANGSCEQCSTRYYVNSFGICQEVNTLCNSYDNRGNCLSCYPGFTLVSGTCLKEQKQISDDNCKTWDKSVCVECSFGAFFLPNRTCKAANPLCKTFNTSNGDCLTCYDSFEVSKGNCIKSNQSLNDANCAEFFGDICLKCSKGFIFLDNGKCGLVDPSCQNFSIMTGECTSCYMGYSLSFGKCINSTVDVSSIDPNCAQFKNNVCFKCSKNFFFKTGVCTAVNPLCNGYNSQTGACTGCFDSYVLQGPNCIQDKEHTLTDPNCASWMQGICLKCATRTFMNGLGLCENVDINCNTYNSANGKCTSCYPGFELKSGSCVKAISPSSCNKFKPDGSCEICGKGSYLSQGSCILIDPQCANFDAKSQTCLGCYPGFSLLNGACQVSKVDSQYEVQNCYAYDSTNQCIKCYDRFYLSNNECKAVSVFCKTYDDNDGGCLSCYTTFTLSSGTCVK